MATQSRLVQADVTGSPAESPTVEQVSFGSRILFGAFATCFSRGINILLSLALMPVLFRNLAKEELGIWLLLLQTWSLLGLSDLGFGLILTRRIAFALGKTGMPVGGVNLQAVAEVSELFAVGRRVYFLFGLVAFAFSLTAGFVYIGSLELHQVPRKDVWLAWAVLCLSQSLGIWANVWICLMQGIGLVGWDALIATFVNTATILFQLLVVLSGGGLVSLATVAALGTVAQRCLYVGLIRRQHRLVQMPRGKWSSSVFRSMFPSAFRAWMTSLGYLLAANTDQFFVAAHAGPAAIPIYRAAFLLIINLHLLAGVFSAASPVFVSQLWQGAQLTEIRCILRRNALAGLLTMGCGGAVILALGSTLFELWLGPGNFVGYWVLGIFLGTFMLEHHANVFSTCGRATNDEAYALSSIAGGGLKLVLAYVLTSRLGLAGLALSTVLAQALTNDWYMVYRSAKRLGINLRRHVADVVVPVGVVSTLAFGLAVLVNRLLASHAAELRVAGVSLAGALVLAAAVWKLVLDDHHRHWVRRRLGLA